MLIPEYVPFAASSSRDPFEAITANLQNLSKTINMPGITPLGERDANSIMLQSKSAKSAKEAGKSENANASGAKKRKSTDANDAPVDPDDIEIPDGTEFEWNSNQIRSKIRQYINSGEMKIGEFQRKIGVSSKSYGTFMGQNGPTKGMGSATYMGACEFFMKRDLAGLKMPRAKKAKTAAAASSATTDGNADKDNTNSKKQSATKDKAANKHDVSAIILEGESRHAVPIYDTCDDIRTKINRYLRETGETNAGFVRTINSAAFPEDATSTAQTASTRQLTTVLNGKGPVKGCESPVFYAAYVFFEKLRLKEGKPKSKKRTEMEGVWKKQRGMELVDITTKGVFTKAGQHPYVDKYGQLQFA